MILRWDLVKAARWNDLWVGEKCDGVKTKFPLMIVLLDGDYPFRAEVSKVRKHWRTS
jgi:hypothetical protein